MSGLVIQPQGEREIRMTRVFHAPPQLVFDAYTKPDLVRRWLLGPPGWSMPVCEIDLRVGGKYRYVWQRGGTSMGMGGIYREIEVPVRFVATELFDSPWYPGEALGTFEFVGEGQSTRLEQTMRYESKQARDSVLESPMESGLTASFDRLAELVENGAPGSS